MRAAPPKQIEAVFAVRVLRMRKRIRSRSSNLIASSKGGGILSCGDAIQKSITPRLRRREIASYCVGETAQPKIEHAGGAAWIQWRRSPYGRHCSSGLIC